MVVDSYYESEWIKDENTELKFNLSQNIKNTYYDIIKKLIKQDVLDNNTDLKDIIEKQKQ